MEEKNKDYDLKLAPGRAILSGQLSLSNPVEFDELFAPVRKGIEEATEEYAIDLVGAVFMSSSGITSLARVVLHAQNHEKKLVLKVDESVLWQRKTVVALQNLWKELRIEKN